jgi:hypothetical protein
MAAQSLLEPTNSVERSGGRVTKVCNRMYRHFSPLLRKTELLCGVGRKFREHADAST